MELVQGHLQYYGTRSWDMSKNSKHDLGQVLGQKCLLNCTPGRPRRRGRAGRCCRRRACTSSLTSCQTHPMNRLLIFMIISLQYLHNIAAVTFNYRGCSWSTGHFWPRPDRLICLRRERGCLQAILSLKCMVRFIYKRLQFFLTST